LSSSYADTATSASYAPSVSPFPYTGSAIISGSLEVIGLTTLYNSGSTVFEVSGSSGALFSIVDDLSGDIFTVSSGSVNVLNISSSGETVLSGSLIVTGGTTGSFTGSFTGDGSGLYNLPTQSFESNQIATGSVTGSVDVGSNSFTLVSESIALMNVRANGGFENGLNVTASGAWSHAEGGSTTASGYSSHAEGASTTASGYSSHAEGIGTIASGSYSHAEGGSTTASGYSSHAEGASTTASGDGSHAEGFGTTSSGQYSHAEGNGTTASGYASHAEGTGTTASGDYSHAEGINTIASGNYSHAEGSSTTALGGSSHAEGIGTIASGSYQLAAGRYNTHNNTDSLVVIGNGANDSTRSDLALFNSQSITFNQPVTGSIFTGSFVGDGSGLTGISASYLASSASNGTGISTFTYNGTSNVTVEVSGASALSSNTLTKWTGDAFANTSITDDGTLVTFSTDALFQGDIIVQGTASFQNVENLLVADRFVLFASGSNATGDGGIVVQQGTQNIGELYGYDSGVQRWGFTGSFDATSTSYAPEAYIAAVVDVDGGQSDIAKYQKNGNIRVSGSDIYIYA
jgi:hypothetical protein